MSIQDFCVGAGPIVLKIGSSLLMEADGQTVRAKWLASLAAEMVALPRPALLVSSGAVALGRARLSRRGKAPSLAKAAAAAGQMRLAQAWDQALQGRSAQILLSPSDLEDRSRYLNARDTLETLLAHDLVPVINENDSVATLDYRFGDNDRLSARVAQAVGAALLIILSDVDGLMTADPATDPAAELIMRVPIVDDAVLALGGQARATGVGTGGMAAKLKAASIATRGGTPVLLINGRIDRPLSRFAETGRGTYFESSASPLDVRKAWLAGLQHPKGRLMVDAGAVRAVTHGGKSLLAAGVKRVHGAFQRGDLVGVAESPASPLLAQGLVGYSAHEAERIIGLSSEDIAKTLGRDIKRPLIHRDDLYVFTKERIDG